MMGQSGLTGAISKISISKKSKKKQKAPRLEPYVTKPLTKTFPE